MAGITTTVKNTSGSTHHFYYVPPNGITLDADATYTIQGILDTILAMAEDNTSLLQYLQDVGSGALTVTYDLDVANSIGPGSITEAMLNFSLIATLVRTTGVRQFIANQSMGGFKLTSLGAPTAAGDATNKLYVDTADNALEADIDVLQAEASSMSAELLHKLDKRGDTMIGRLLLSMYPSLADEAATKHYVDHTIDVKISELGAVQDTTLDKEKYVVAPTAGDDSNTLLTISDTPYAHGNVQVFINGVRADLGNGVNTQDCYFKSGAVIRRISEIQAGDVLFWNGVRAGYNLETDDRVDLDYAVKEAYSSSSIGG